MKKIWIGFCLLTLLLLGGCGGKTLTVTGGEIAAAADGRTVRFTVRNDTGGEVRDLTLTVELLGKDGAVLEQKTAAYPTAVPPAENATVTCKSEQRVSGAQVTAFAYKTEAGKSIEKTLDKPVRAKTAVTTTTDGVIRTRAALAERLIDDVNAQFRKKGYTAQGSYDAEKKQLILASYYGLPAEACRTSYRYDPAPWDTLAESMASMSKTCMEEFQRYGFSDVHTVIGLLSSDEQLLISAADGEITQNLSGD